MAAMAGIKCMRLRGVAGTISGGRPLLELLSLRWCLLGDESRCRLLLSLASSLGEPSLTLLPSHPRLAGSCRAGGRSAREFRSCPALHAQQHPSHFATPSNAALIGCLLLVERSRLSSGKGTKALMMGGIQEAHEGANALGCLREAVPLRRHHQVPQAELAVLADRPEPVACASAGRPRAFTAHVHVHIGTA